MAIYQSEAQIEAVVSGFESCETDKGAFKHQDHLTVAVCYLQELSVVDATNKLRESLLRFVDHHGVDRRKYNETITVFWLEMVADVLKKLPSDSSLITKCNAVAESLSNAGLAMDYYSPELLSSERARVEFVKPDLKDWKATETLIKNK